MTLSHLWIIIGWAKIGYYKHKQTKYAKILDKHGIELYLQEDGETEWELYYEGEVIEIDGLGNHNNKTVSLQYIYIWVCVCARLRVCVCVCVATSSPHIIQRYMLTHTHTHKTTHMLTNQHTHTHTHIQKK